ncbi:MAG TPA: hypothetical protein VFK10_04960 [Burkholderiaceae bacterium]|nr:hypothetical protein [Burkholderiaceae bacterium]
MHVLGGPQACSGRRGWRRALSAALCVLTVLLGHVVLWRVVSPAASSPGARAAALQVRQLTLPAVPPAASWQGPTAQQEPTTAPPRVALRPQTRAPAKRDARHEAGPHEAVPAVASGAPSVRDEPDAAEPVAATVLDASPTPIYPTRIPVPAQLRFVLQRGSAHGVATLQWRVDKGRYELDMQATLPQGRTVEQHSQGGFDEAGLAPMRLADRRSGRDVRAANFQREHGKITFSGPRVQWPLYRGTQDRLSWLVQLVAIASAGPQSLQEGAELSMWVAGARGALAIWRFEVREREAAADGGEATLWRLVREPAHPYDVRLEVWLDPARGYWPARMRQTQVPGGEPLQWSLRDDALPEPGS